MRSIPVPWSKWVAAVSRNNDFACPSSSPTPLRERLEREARAGGAASRAPTATTTSVLGAALLAQAEAAAGASAPDSRAATVTATATATASPMGASKAGRGAAHSGPGSQGGGVMGAMRRVGVGREQQEQQGRQGQQGGGLWEGGGPQDGAPRVVPAGGVGEDEQDMFGEEFTLRVEHPSSVTGDGGEVPRDAAAQAAAGDVRGAAGAGQPPASTPTALLVPVAGAAPATGSAAAAQAALVPAAAVSAASGQVVHAPGDTPPLGEGQGAGGSSAALGDVLSGFELDSASGMYYSSDVGVWYNPSTSLYMDANTGKQRGTRSIDRGDVVGVAEICWCRGENCNKHTRYFV